MIRTSITFVALLIALSGCDSNSGPEELLPDTVHSDTRDGLEMYWGQWEAEGVSNYVLSNFRRCVCLENLTLFTTIVEGGVPVSATRQRFEQEPEDIPVSDVPYPTVHSMFELIDWGFDQEPDSLGVIYRTDTGLPERITIDFNQGVADEEIEVFVNEFQVSN